METIEGVVVPDTSQLEAEALELRDRSEAIEITTPFGYESAGRELVKVASNIKALESLFDPPIAKVFSAHKALCDLKNKLLAYPRAAERAWKTAMADYNRREQEELQRQEAELQEQLRRKEEDRQIAEAEILSSQGHKEEAEAVLAQPVILPAVRMMPTVAQGVSTRKRYTFRILDASKINRAYLVPDEKKIRAQVNALGPDAAALVGGIEVLQDTMMIVRSR